MSSARRPTRRPDRRPPSRAPWLVAATTSVIAVVAVVALVRGGGDGLDDPVAARTAELEAAEQERTATQVTELNDATTAAMEVVTPLLDELRVASDPAADAATDDQLAAWRRALDEAEGHLPEPTSAATEVNLTREGLRHALGLLRAAVDEHTVAASVGGTEGARLRELAADRIEDAVVAWSLAATQLDLANVAAGHGHTHLYLPAGPDSDAFTPDGTPPDVGDPDAHEDHETSS